MAKRGSARRSRREADLIDEDEDEFAWQSPDDEPPKKKKRKKKKRKGSSSRSKKDTGRTGRSSSSRSRSGSSSGRKSTGKRRRTSSEDDGMGASSRRRRPTTTKKKGVDPVILISIVTCSLLVCVGIVVVNNQPDNVVVRNEEDMFAKAKKAQEEGMHAFREWNRLRETGPISAEKAKHKEAHSKLQEAMTLITQILDEHKGPDGFTLPEYEGYEEELGTIAKYLIDLEKGGRTH